MKKILLWSAGAFGVIIVIVAIASAGSPAATNTVSAVPTGQFTATAGQPVPQVTATEAAAPTAPEFSPQVEQARGSAQSYLSLKGFSRNGLITQLSSQYADKFPKDVATQAVDSLSVDWNAQAAKAAQSYLDFMSFSCSGLTQQLASTAADKFTKAQATYGAHQTSACK
jgi:hypothetical protein